jgi:hypothetical protein
VISAINCTSGAIGRADGAPTRRLRPLSRDKAVAPRLDLECGGPGRYVTSGMNKPSIDNRAHIRVVAV